MDAEGLAGATRAMENAFFEGDAKVERERLRTEERRAREALESATGIHDDAMLANLAGLGVRAETLCALALIPLIQVAWADGAMEEKERRAILAAAETTGLRPGTPSHRLLEIWTEEAPPPDLVEGWRTFLRNLCAELPDPERERLRGRIVGYARNVAKAAGGFLGIGAISASEEAVLADLERAFERV